MINYPGNHRNVQINKIQWHFPHTNKQRVVKLEYMVLTRIKDNIPTLCCWEWKLAVLPEHNLAGSDKCPETASTLTPQFHFQKLLLGKNHKWDKGFNFKNIHITTLKSIPLKSTIHPCTTLAATHCGRNSLVLVGR